MQGVLKKADVENGNIETLHQLQPDGFRGGAWTTDGTEVVTNGGRVLNVTALGSDVAAAVRAAYGAIDRIEWDGMHYRRDIGRRALERES